MKWINVNERLPIDSGFVLARSVGGLSMESKFSTGTIVVYFSKLHSKADAFQSQHRASSVSVTHWMPLPEPPK